MSQQKIQCTFNILLQQISELENAINQIPYSNQQLKRQLNSVKYLSKKIHQSPNLIEQSNLIEHALLPKTLQLAKNYNTWMKNSKIQAIQYNLKKFKEPIP